MDVNNKRDTFQYLSSEHLLVFLTVEKVFWKVYSFLFVSPSLFYGLLYLVMIVVWKRMRIQHFIFISGDQTHKRMPHNHEGRHPLHHGVHRSEVVAGWGVVNVSSDKIIFSNRKLISLYLVRALIPWPPTSPSQLVASTMLAWVRSSAITLVSLFSLTS